MLQHATTGGAGTAAAGFAAGVPSIIIPFSNNQFAWVHRAFDVGVGSKPIQRKEFHSAQLADAISFATQTPVLKKRSSQASVYVVRMGL